MTDPDLPGRNFHARAYSEPVPSEHNMQHISPTPVLPNTQHPANQSVQYFEPPAYNYMHPQNNYGPPVQNPHQQSFPDYRYPPGYGTGPPPRGYHQGVHSHQPAGFVTGNYIPPQMPQGQVRGQYNHRQRGHNTGANKSWRRSNDQPQRDSLGRSSVRNPAQVDEHMNMERGGFVEAQDLGDSYQHLHGARPKQNPRGRNPKDSKRWQERRETEKHVERSDAKVVSDSEATEREKRRPGRMAKSCEEIDALIAARNKDRDNRDMTDRGRHRPATWHPRERSDKQSGKQSSANKETKSDGEKQKRRRSLSLERKRRSRSRSKERQGYERLSSSQSEDVRVGGGKEFGSSIPKTKDKQSASRQYDTDYRSKNKGSAQAQRRPDDSRRFKPSDSDKYSYNKKSSKGRYLKCWSTSQSNRSSSSESLPNETNRSLQNSTTSPESQTGSMIEALTDGTYECMVCCDVIKCQSPVWSCQGCYTVFHLHCIRKWARSPVARLQVESADGWRCPACQKVCMKIPSAYRCFCDKVRDPDWVRMETPHSCGELCKKKRSNTTCPHPCNILCHPGPCPSCPVTITKTCTCGQSQKSIRCGTVSEVHCDVACGKKLNCGLHICKQICHDGDCEDCTVMIEQECYCGRSNRDVVCGTKIDKSTDGPGCYSCQDKCARQLSCGNHTCERPCHPGSCDTCKLLPSVITHCPCGQTSLSSLLPSGKSRTSCTDTVPTCDNICNKKLSCGSQDEPHTCQYTCHDGDCGPCTGTSTVKCRCGHMDRDIHCAELIVKSPPPTCNKRCNKKRQCTRHRCNQRCCVDVDHKCPLVCGRKLSCGSHRCEEPCHTGNCEQCWQTSFDELTCHCGIEIIFPPIPCGIRPPECVQPCSRQHDCDHPIRHNCHTDVKCPPCTQLVQRSCMGGHEVRHNIACHVKDISCGRYCGKQLPCQQHKCPKTCHKDECNGENCTQPCLVPRPECGHPCSVPCHPGKDCPKLPCKTQITITCKCGNRHEKTSCMQGGDDIHMAHAFQRLATSQLASKMKDIQSGQSVDISNLMHIKDGHGHRQRQLECSVDCAMMERNKRVAEALNIDNANLSSKPGAPGYSQFLKDQARQNPSFVASVEKDLSNLIQALQQTKQPKKSHSFASMSRAQRQAVHELSELYGCETISYDPEPKRSIVATAVRNKSIIPGVTLTSLIQKELHPKAPTPIPHVCKEDVIRQSVQASKQSTELFDKKPEVIDYFDMVQ